MYMHIYIYTLIYIYIHINIHTYIHTYEKAVPEKSSKQSCVKSTRTTSGQRTEGPLSVDGVRERESVCVCV